MYGLELLNDWWRDHNSTLIQPISPNKCVLVYYLLESELIFLKKINIGFQNCQWAYRLGFSSQERVEEKSRFCSREKEKAKASSPIEKTESSHDGWCWCSIWDWQRVSKALHWLVHVTWWTVKGPLVGSSHMMNCKGTFSLVGSCHMIYNCM